LDNIPSTDDPDIASEEWNLRKEADATQNNIEKIDEKLTKFRKDDLENS